VIMCGAGGGPPEPEGGWPEEIAPCCYGSIDGGWAECDCWVPVFNAPAQQRPNQEHKRLLAAGVKPTTRQGMCMDCAYRPGSPEKSGDESYAGGPDFLEGIARRGERFWCHQGLLIVTAWRHPSGLEVPGHPGAYCPPVVDGVPYQVDGSAGLLCAGWAARRRALTAATR